MNSQMSVSLPHKFSAYAWPQPSFHPHPYPTPGVEDSSTNWALLGSGTQRTHPTDVAGDQSTGKSRLQTPCACFIVPLEFTYETQI